MTTGHAVKASIIVFSIAQLYVPFSFVFSTRISALLFGSSGGYLSPGFKRNCLNFVALTTYFYSDNRFNFFKSF